MENMNLVNYIKSKYDEMEISKWEISDKASILVSGSKIEGFGNANSDIDIYILVNNEEYKKLKEKLRFTDEANTIKYYYKNKRYDCEIWKYEDIKKYIEVTYDMKKLDKNKFPIRLKYDILKFLHNIKIGIPIIGIENYKNFKKEITFDSLGSYEAFKSIFFEHRFIEDITGTFSSRDYGTTIILARELVNICLRGFLALSNETNPSDKWLYRKLIRFSKNNKTELFNEYSYFFYEKIDLEENNIKIFVEKTFLFCKKYNQKILEKFDLETQKIILNHMEYFYPETITFFKGGEIKR